MLKDDLKMGMYTQFPDLTELAGVHRVLHFHQFKVAVPISAFKTRFTFAVGAPTYDPIREQQQVDSLTYAGFKPIAKMYNWFASHIGEHRVLKFYWRKDSELGFTETCFREVWGTHHGIPNFMVCKSGCGFGLNEFNPETPLIKQYFNLIRAPLKLSKEQEAELTGSNYRYLDESELAQYWVNGWPFDAYTEEIEMNYWRQRKESGENDIKSPHSYYCKHQVDRLGF